MSPRTPTPETWALLPSWNAVAPTTSARSAQWLAPFAERTRSISWRNDSAPTSSCDGGENPKPGRTRNAYVRPPSVTRGQPAATSGTSRVPAAPAASG